MAEAVYMLCALTSLACAGFLGRAYKREHLRLLFWSAVCFVGLAINNCLLFVDRIIIPDTDISIARGVVGLLGMVALIYGLIWDAV